MSYIKNTEHFIRFINKVLREDSAVEPEKLLPAQFYLSQIYAKGNADSFTWALKEQGASLLEEDNILQWIADHGHGIENMLDRSPFSLIFTQEFKDTLLDLDTTPGVYNFCREDDKSLYVGKSTRLGQRINSSVQRFMDYDRPLFVKYIAAKSKNDIALLEAYFIASLTPPYNHEGLFEDKLHYSITPLPEWSARIKVYEVERED